MNYQNNMKLLEDKDDSIEDISLREVGPEKLKSLASNESESES